VIGVSVDEACEQQSGKLSNKMKISEMCLALLLGVLPLAAQAQTNPEPPHQADNDCDKIKQEIKDLQDQIEKETAALQKVEGDLARVREKYQKALDSYKAFEKSGSKKSINQDWYEAERGKLLDKLHETAQHIKNIENSIEKMKATIQALKERMAELLDQLANCEKHKKTATSGPATTSESKTVSGLFRAGEVQLNAFGLGGVAHGEMNTTQTHTVIQIMHGTNGQITTVEKTVTETKNHAALQGGLGGAGMDLKYFVTQNVGLGLTGEWIDGNSSIGAVMATGTVRFPIDSNAPYIFAGAGAQFGNGTRAIGELGAGVEHRFTPNLGIFTDASWLFSEHENAAVFRAGVSLAW
jgi:phage shock protein A